MTSLNEVLDTHTNVCFEAMQLVKVKGADYNRQQQEGGDTLFNLKVSTLMGVTKTPTQSLLVRITDKIMRLVSLTSDPEINPEVKDESVKDTIKDTINYLIYLYIMYNEMKSEKNFEVETKENIKSYIQEKIEEKLNAKS